jgi:polyphosphate kinase
MLDDEFLRKQAMNNLAYNLRDNVNSYVMKEDGTYAVKEQNGEAPFNIHKEFFHVTRDIVMSAKLF